MLLKSLRLSKNLSQQNLCEAIDCPISVYSRYERGERYPSAEVISKLAQFYGVSIEYLLELPEPANPQFPENITRLLNAALEADDVAVEDAINFLERHHVDLMNKRLPKEDQK